MWHVWTAGWRAFECSGHARDGGIRRSRRRADLGAEGADEQPALLGRVSGGGQLLRHRLQVRLRAGLTRAGRSLPEGRAICVAVGQPRLRVVPIEAEAGVVDAAVDALLRQGTERCAQLRRQRLQSPLREVGVAEELVHGRGRGVQGEEGAEELNLGRPTPAAPVCALCWRSLQPALLQQHKQHKQLPLPATLAAAALSYSRGELVVRCIL